MNEHEKSILRSLIQDERWGVLVKASNDLIAHVKADSPVRDSEWETIKAVLTQEGKIEGIKSFIQEIYKITA